MARIRIRTGMALGAGAVIASASMITPNLASASIDPEIQAKMCAAIGRDDPVQAPPDWSTWEGVAKELTSFFKNFNGGPETAESITADEFEAAFLGCKNTYAGSLADAIKSLFRPDYKPVRQYLVTLDTNMKTCPPDKIKIDYRYVDKNGNGIGVCEGNVIDSAPLP